MIQAKKKTDLNMVLMVMNYHNSITKNPQYQLCAAPEFISLGMDDDIARSG